MIDATLRDGVYEVALTTEPCNEIGTGMLAALENVVASLDPDAAGALILHSTLPKGFGAGADLRELEAAVRQVPAEHQRDRLCEFLDRIHAVMNAIDGLPLTTIAAIHGVCFGGGFELALTCDLRVAETSARFCFPELRLGLIPGFGGIPRLRRELGEGVIRDLILTGRSLGAKRAHALGLVSQVVAPDKALEVARRMAARACTFDRQAMRAAKRFTKQIPHAELQREKEQFIELFQKPVVAQALQRFVQSRDVRPYL